MSNRDVTLLSREELEANYEQSQWALAWALKQLGGFILVHDIDMISGENYRIWYRRDELKRATHIELREDDGT